MKKAYEKPQIVFDSFELSQSIAAGCEYLSNATRGDCAVKPGPDIPSIFSQSGICESVPAPGYEDQLCYDVPNDWENVFSS